ncbi:hypothetical protein [Solidesulfovibrio sp. C21]|uniref:hypothetical protein n=1 Tax=Solidesulfovibrio sp. C21 TaxID=3398613 RepID=UPI0039FCF470
MDRKRHGLWPGLPDHAAAKLELTRQGTFRIYNSVPDMGQGNAARACLCGIEVDALTGMVRLGSP